MRVPSAMETHKKRTGEKKNNNKLAAGREELNGSNTKYKVLVFF